jgi:hypothetical protein
MRARGEESERKARAKKDESEGRRELQKADEEDETARARHREYLTSLRTKVCVIGYFSEEIAITSFFTPL